MSCFYVRVVSIEIVKVFINVTECICLQVTIPGRTLSVYLLVYVNF